MLFFRPGPGVIDNKNSDETPYLPLEKHKNFSTKYISVFLNTRKADLNTLAEFN